MEAAKMTIRSSKFNATVKKQQTAQKTNIKLALTYLQHFNQFGAKHLHIFWHKKHQKWVVGIYHHNSYHKNKKEQLSLSLKEKNNSYH